MDPDVEKMHLRSLEEYVLDEEKIVTYCWLSKVLCIHVDLSKELLHKFSSDPSHGSTVYLTYVISGKLKDGSHRILVVGQDEFEEAKSDFDIIISHHVYSVQKKKEMPSENLLYMVNSDTVENDVEVSRQIAAIKCSLSIRRTEEEMAKLRLISLSKKVPSKTANASKTADSVNQEVEKKDEKETVDKPLENKPKSAAGGIAAMFAAQTSKSSGAPSSSSKLKAKPVAKKGGGINSFFSKVPKTESPPKSEAQGKSNGKQQTDEPMDVDDSTEKADNVESVDKVTKPEDKSVVKDAKFEEKSAVKNATADAGKASPSKAVQPKVQEAPAMKTNGKTLKSKPKRKSKQKSSAKQEKTRKRIKVIDSDSSDDMFGSEDEEEPVDRNSPSPSPARKIIDSDDEVIPPTPQPERDNKNHRKRKVVKTKSYLDEEGFLVTKKVTVYESCSESESENKGNAKKAKEEEESPSKSSNKDNTTKAKEEEESPSKSFNKDNTIQTKDEEESTSKSSNKDNTIQTKDEEESTSKSSNKGNTNKAREEEESKSKHSKAREFATKATKEKKTTNSNKDKKKPAKKAVSPVKNKQSSLMNFFKKA